MKTPNEKIDERIKNQRKKLDDLINNPVEKKILSLKIEMGPEQAAMFEFIKILTREDDENIIGPYLFFNGMTSKFEELKKMRDYIYSLGSLEPIADKIKIGLTDKEKQIAATQIDIPNKSIDDYWEMGYVSVRCPFCGHPRAIWHPENKKFYCFEGCKKQDEFENKPKKN